MNYVPRFCVENWKKKQNNNKQTKTKQKQKQTKNKNKNKNRDGLRIFQKLVIASGTVFNRDAQEMSPL